MVASVDGLWQRMIDPKVHLEAWKNARRGNEHLRIVQEIDSNYMEYAEKIRLMLVNHTYEPSKFIEFDKDERGKMRHIAYMAIWPDQWLQWIWKLVVEPEINRRLIDQTYGSIKGRGPHKAIDKLKEYMRDKEATKFCLDFDAQKCFDSVPQERVFAKFCRKFKEKDVQWLTGKFIFAYKKGFPLGCVFSHPLVNFYLDELDRYIKEALHCHHYVRYMDNGEILGRFTHWLRRVRVKIAAKMKEMGMTMKGNWQIYPVEARGVKFVGYRIFHDFTLLVQKTKTRIKRVFKESIRRLKRGEDPTPTDIGRFHSYSGTLGFCDGWRLSKNTTRLFERLWKAKTWMQSPQHRTRAPSSS